MSSLSAASALPVTDYVPARTQASQSAPAPPAARAADGWRSKLGRRGERVLISAAVFSLIVHLLGVTGAADWLAGLYRYDEADPGPPLRAVLKPPPPPTYQQPATVTQRFPKPRPVRKPAPMFTAPTVAESPAPEPTLPLVEATVPPATPVEVAHPVELPVAQSAIVAAAEPIPEVESAPAEPSLPPMRMPKRIDLIGTLFAGEQNFMVGTGGFRLRHDGNRYEISVLGKPQGLARLLFSGEFSGVSRGAITPTGLQPSEYTEDRGRSDKRESATLDWESGVIRLRDDKVVAIEPPVFDRLSVILQFYYRPPEASELSMRVTGTRVVETYIFRRLRNEPIELPSGPTVDAQVWRVSHDNGEPRIDLWMSPEYHYLPLRLRVYSRKEFGGRYATLNIDEIRVED